MKFLLENWRRRINEDASAFGRYSMPSGKASGPCPQGEEQNGFQPDGSPICRPKPELESKGEIIVKSREEMVNILKNNPPQEIHVDKPKGSIKKFGGDIPIKLPFDYGEWPDFINPADGMAWDCIIVPSATKDDPNLIPVGYVAYNEKKPGSMWNDKIIVAPSKKRYTQNDRRTIEDVFIEMDYFDSPVWY